MAYRPTLMGQALRTTTTTDGRTLAFAVWGDTDGFPVVQLHGTPGCRLERWPDEDLYRGLGVCLVTHDRAGYGRSDRHLGRRVADEADDVLALADHLGFERFGVTGGSGGGHHSLACAALLPDRVVRAACVVGPAPLGKPGLEQEAWLAGQDPWNVKEFGWATEGEDVLRPELEKELAAMAARVEVDPSTILGDIDLSDTDRAELQRPERMQIIRESFTEQAATGVDGWVDDDLATVAPWGFDVGQITVPVLVRYGATDVLVPPAHGEWLAANVPGCVVKVDDDAGHLGSDPVQEITEHMTWLRDGVAPADSRPPGGARE
jgi:pimeloyl-ACP methyl ester carboxylesterase